MKPPIHEAAAAYINAGYRVILLRSFSKEPEAREWQRPDNSITPDLAFKFNVSRNIGLLTGGASGGLVDFDLDSPEACRLAAALLPATAEFGRKSKPTSHRFYRVSEGAFPTRRYHDPDDNGILFETRGDGCQTMVPPSIHPSREALEWTVAAPPLAVSTDHVNFLAGRLAAACVLLRCWAPGQRDQLATALCGFLLRVEREDLTADAINGFVGVIAKAAGDEEWQDRQKAHRLAEAMARDGRVPGLPALAEILGEKRARAIRKWLGGATTARQEVEQLRREKTPSQEKNNRIATRVRALLCDGGEFYRTESDLFYFDDAESSLCSLSSALFRAKVNAAFGINGAERLWAHVLEELQAHALNDGKPTEVHRFAYCNEAAHFLNLGSNRVLVTKAGEQQTEPNGFQGVLFLSSDGDRLPLEESA